MLKDKLKILRRQADMSQEQLSDKLNVSRQAITKWETGGGMPDIENLKAIAELFQISLDELLEQETKEVPARDFLFESVTEYDIDEMKSYDITFMGANTVILFNSDHEKLKIRLASNQINNIQNVLKVKLDDIKKRIDVDIRRSEDLSETAARGSLYIFIQFPRSFVDKIELAGNTETLEAIGLEAGSLEYTGKVYSVKVEKGSYHMELNSNEDMDICCREFSGWLDCNQISSISHLRLPEGSRFQSVKKGIANRILYEKDGKPADDFSIPAGQMQDGDLTVELNGMKSELIISTISNME